MKLKKIILPALGLGALVSTLPLSSCHKAESTSNQTEKKPTIQQIFINANNAMTEYSLGEEFNKDNLSITGVFSDNSQSNIPLDQCVVDFALFDSSRIGEYTIYVNYFEGNIKASNHYTVRVESIAFKQSKYLKGITVEGVPSQIIAGENLDLSNILVSAEYSDNTIVNVTDKVKKDLTGFDNMKMGTYQLKFSYGEEYEFNGKKEFKNSETFVLVNVDAYPFNIKFVSGTLSVEQDTVGPDGTMTSIDMSDWIVKGTFIDKNNKKLKDEYELRHDRLSIEGFNAGSAGKQQCTLVYRHPGQLQTYKTIITIDVIAIPEPTYYFSADDLAGHEEKFTKEEVINKYIAVGNSCQYKAETSEKKFGDLGFNSRLQTNGQGNTSKNYIKITLEKDSTVAVIGRNQKGSENIAFYDANGNAMSSYMIFDSNSLTKNKADLKAGTYYFYATQAVQVYGIQIWEK